MLTGRFQLAAPGDKPPSKTAVVLGFGPRDGPAGGRRRRVDARRGLAARRRRRRSRSAIATRPRWARSTCCRPASTHRAGPGRRRDGPRRRRPGADARGLAGAHPAAPGRAQEPAPQPGVRGRDRQRLQRRDAARRAAAAVPQAVDRWPRRRSTRCTRPCARRSTTRSSVLRQRVPPTFEKQVRDFLAVHNKGGEACPRCGTRITEVKAGGFVTSYCRGCQR